MRLIFNAVVPAEFTLPPYFFPDRSRFFNLATLYVDTVEALKIGLWSHFTKEKLGFTFYFDLNAEKMADENYVKWENKGGKELQLSSFKLTNRQMLWLSIAHVQAAQHHTNFDEILSLKNDNFHLNYKSRIEFQEAFQCRYLSEQELKMISEFQSRYDAVYKSIWYENVFGRNTNEILF